MVLEADEIKAFIYFPDNNARTDPMDIAAILARNRDSWEEVDPDDYEEMVDDARGAKFMKGSVELKTV